MRNRRPLLSDDDALSGLWPSFTDVTSTIALILFVLVLLAFVRNILAGKKLLAYQADIAASEQRLRALGDELKQTAAELEAGNKQLASTRKQVEEGGREMQQLRGKLQGIAVLRVDVLTRVKQALEAELARNGAPPGPAVVIGDNGNIVIKESLLFGYNSYVVNADGKPFLQTLARVLGHALTDPGVRENVDAVLIVGHTDERGSPAFNRELSARRANAVLDYMFEVEPSLELSFGSYFASTAFSEFRPLNPEKTEAAYEQNRRIEISLVLKDPNLRGIIDDYLSRTSPAPSPSP